MKLNLKTLSGYHIGATDGEVGKVTDFYFDKTSWTIRYLVVETGNWLEGRKVLLSTQAIQTIDDENKRLTVNATIDQVKNSPHIDINQPVSRQNEMDLHSHYPWKGYWGADMWPGGLGTVGMIMPVAETLEDAVHHSMQEPEKEDPSENTEQHLFSTDKVKDCTIHATDGDVGEIEGFVVDSSTWKINYLIADTGSWLPGKKVLLTPEHVTEMDVRLSSLKVDISVDKLKHYPEFHNDKSLDEIVTDNQKDLPDEPVTL